MNEKKMGLYRGSTSYTQEGNLSVQDLIQYLSNLARLHNNARTGNLKLSEGLRQLAKALRPHASRSVLHLTDILKEEKFSGSQKSSLRRMKATLPADLESISWEGIEKILNDDNYNKSQLIELGVSRFGISYSKLTKLSHSDVLNSIRAALDHEMSLDVISREARRGGASRSS